MKKLFGILLVLSLFVPLQPTAQKVHPAHADWSATRPAVNLTHLFKGEINKRGKPVGFHARPGGRDPDDSGVKTILSPANAQGVYVARVWIQARRRTKTSSFFPDHLTPVQVVEAVLNAYHRGRVNGGRFTGPSGLGFNIEGYLLGDGRINTAYPVYRR